MFGAAASTMRVTSRKRSSFLGLFGVAVAAGLASVLVIFRPAGGGVGGGGGGAADATTSNLQQQVVDTPPGAGDSAQESARATLSGALRARSLSGPGIALYKAEILEEFPHDPKAFTQGLEFDRHNGTEVFWESTGMWKVSEVRQVEVASGHVMRSVRLPAHLFGEGLTRVHDRLLQLTYQRDTLLEYDHVDSFHLADFSAGAHVRTAHTKLKDGWGLEFDGSSLVVTDSTPLMLWMDPDTLEVRKQANVTLQGVNVGWANELELIGGEIWANVWQTPCIARIQPHDAAIAAWVDLTAIVQRQRSAASEAGRRVDVLNGIAYDADTDRLFVTGKYWDKVYLITLVELENPAAAVDDFNRRCVPARFRPRPRQ